MSDEELLAGVKKIGISLIGQTADLAPADKKLYALRDSIACVDNMQLIASSIMSKKIAGGANKIVLEVTCGSGAFMKTKEDAVRISDIMKNIGKLAGIETVCVITNMDEPIGKNVGNSLEIVEAIEALQGNMTEDVKEVILTLGSYIIKLAGKGNNLEENRRMILENISNGKAYSKFLELVDNQGGDVEYLKDTGRFEKAKYILPVIAQQSGFVERLDAKIVGEISVYLGAGRMKKEDEIDHAARNSAEEKSI